MSITSCISHPPGARYLKIYGWQLEFCDGNQCAAALMSYFEFVHNWKLQQRQQAKKANDELEASGKARSQEETLLQWHTAKDLEQAVMLFKRDTIDKAIDKVLVPKGAVEVRKNPNPRRWYDHTKHFLFKPQTVNDWLAKHYPPAQPSPTIDEKSEIVGVSPISEKSEIPGGSPIDEKSEIISEKSAIDVRKIGNVPKKSSTKNTDKNDEEDAPSPQPKADLSVPPASSSSFSSVDGEQTEDGKINVNFLVDGLCREFHLSRPQKKSVLGYAESEGIDYVIEKADIVRSEPRENLARTFLAALKGDWKPSAASREILEQRERQRRREERERQEQAECDAKERERAQREQAQQAFIDRIKPGILARWGEADDERRRQWLEGYFGNKTPKDVKEPSGLIFWHVWPKMDPEGYAAYLKAFPPQKEMAA